MKQIKCPEILNPKQKGQRVFLAGGITGCPNWQAEIVEKLKFHDIVLVNPRRDDFDYNDPNMAWGQIEWEFNHLQKCDVILFWFPEETLCPITLFELGKFHMNPDYEVVVGCHPNYARKFDVVTQLDIAGKDLKVVFSIPDLVEQLESIL